MMERAEWRTAWGAPRTALGVHLGRERWLGLPVGFWTILYGAVVTVLVFGLNLVGFGPLFVLSLGLLFRVDRRLYEPPVKSEIPRIAAKGLPERFFNLAVAPWFAKAPSLAADPHPDAAYAVQIALYQGERATGGDEGMVAFSEGWLVYEGHTAAFSFSPRDVVRSFQKGLAWTLILPEGQRLGLRSYDPGWEAAMAEWLRRSPPEGLSRLPPLAPNAVRRHAVTVRVQVAACLLLGIGLGGAAVAFAGSLEATILLLALTFTALGALCAGWSSRRAA